MIHRKKYFTLQEAIDTKVNSTSVFIIANECLKKTDEVGRYFTVFESFASFLKMRNNYPHCHELFVDHKNNEPDPKGRLVFDFDIKDYDVPFNFKRLIENTIADVVDTYFDDSIDSNLFEYVWSTSPNPAKLSKHLTVKNLYFDDWITLSKCFYQLLCIVWDDTQPWIPSSDLIDSQIVRNRASLRMVGSRKIKGRTLRFDNPAHTLTDSLIRIYTGETEQLVTIKNINKSALQEIDYATTPKEKHIAINRVMKIVDPSYDDLVYKNAFKMVDSVMPDIFKPGKVSGNCLQLLRVKSSKCILSGRVHDSDNAYIIITYAANYQLYFGCWRRCGKKMLIGYISLSDYDNISISPDFRIH